MTAARTAFDEQHRYPPHTSSSRSTRSTYGDDGAETISYIIHTETAGVSDLRLQVSHEASSSKQPLRPVYFRERALSEQNEIVDNIIDASTGRICWTIHRPTRGWYLYLRSPELPPGTAIAIRSAKTAEYNSASTPLAFSLHTKVRPGPLARVKPRINTDASTSTRDAEHQYHDDDAGESTKNGLEIDDSAATADGTVQDVAVAATGRENPKSTTLGHTRRRSRATGSGTHALPNSPSKSKRLSAAVTSSPMIPEDDAEEPTSSTGRKALSTLTIPTNTSSSHSSPGGDRPYSPTVPLSYNPASSDTPLKCNLLLTDATTSSTGLKPSWARWAWCMLPSEVRPSLALDTDKSFSLFWTDVPGMSGSSSGVEVARFMDQSGRWLWNSQTRGRLVLQQSAMEAIGLQSEFWITACLAYIQFLEDKDAYDAARDA